MKFMMLLLHTFVFALTRLAVEAEIPVTVFDFEDVSELSNFTTEFSSIHQSTENFKSGSHCLLWQSTNNRMSVSPRLILSFATRNSELSSKGVKLWMYRQEASESGNLTITFRKTEKGRTTVVGESTFITQNFQNWRAVWLSYEEMLINKSKDVTSMEISAQHPDLLDHGGVCFDLLRFVQKVSADSRDAIVPHVPSPKYDVADFWQQTYRWFEVSKHPPPLKAYISRNSTCSWYAWKRSFQRIERRIENWYASAEHTSYDYSRQASGKHPDFRRLRWDSLMEQAKQAHELYEKLMFNDSSKSKIVGPPLFAKDSEFGNDILRKKTSSKSLKLKFNYIMTLILFPLTMEYKLRTRKKKMIEAINNECKCLQSTNKTEQILSLNRLGVYNQQLLEVFLNRSHYNESKSLKLKSTIFPTKSKSCEKGLVCSENFEKLKLAIESLNKNRLRRIFLVLRYLKHQGWATGSGLGSLDHEMNDGFGYMHSVFLLRNQLEMANVLNDTLDTMKWYNDFGEIYQSALEGHFDYDGTTADRMRTILMYRLFTVLMIPMTSFEDKVRDMYALTTWIDNALTINRGLGGMIKPDGSSFHHYTFYGSSYTPQAVHVAALIDYFLEGTCFALSPESRQNLRGVLHTMSIVAVTYSVPSSISGRFPNYTNSKLVEMIPAYAYTTIYLKPKETTSKLCIFDAFSRLYNKSNPSVQQFLSKGTKSHANYLNSIGSLEILQDLQSRKDVLHNVNPPSGHWNRNFAAMSIHRRNEWAVTVKGFNRWVWDFEKSSTENVFGVFQSHGPMLIANSEEALRAHDVNSGWDWTRTPGTTTINVDLQRIEMVENERNYNKQSLAGGTSFYGSRHGEQKHLKNGVFGMDFSKPNYTCTTDSYLCDVQFSFKKSVFFFDDLIVCLGSDITAQQVEPYYTQTTLFQDKLDLTEPYAVLHNDNRKFMSSGSIYHYQDWTRERNITLKDTKGNLYHIPNPSKSGLNISIGIQTSKDRSGRIDTKGRYVTAWLRHNSTRDDVVSTNYITDDHYEYAVMVASKKSPVNASKFAIYEVQQKNQEAHIVKLNRYPRDNSVTHGYVVFQEGRYLAGDGIIRNVSEPCVVMSESATMATATSNFFIAVSLPGFDFVIDDSKKGRQPCSGGKLGKNRGRDEHGKYPQNAQELDLDDLYCSKSEQKSISVHLADYITGLDLEKVIVNDKVIASKSVYNYLSIERNTGHTIVHFMRLANGFTTEAHFRYDVT